MTKVLIAEDNDKLAAYLQQFLQRKGMESDAVHNGSDALKSFISGNYNLLIFDVRLPSIDGVTLCQQIRQRAKGRDIPIILMSGVVKEPSETERLIKELHLSGYLAKPFQGAQLSDAISRSLSKQLAEMPQAPVPAPAPPTSQPEARPEAKTETTPFKGQLEKAPFDRVLATLLERKGTGILYVAHNDKRRKFYLVKGAPFDIVLAPESDGFGHYLAGKGLATDAEIGAYEERKRKEGGDPREIFIKMGCLSPEAFLDENRLFLNERLIECFSWNTGVFSFEPKPSFISEHGGALSFMPRVFLHGFRRYMPPGKINLFLEKKGNLFLSPTPQFFEYMNFLFDEPLADRIFSIIDGTRTGTGIIKSIEADNDAALALLFTMDYLKMLSFSDSPVSEAQEPPFPIRERQRVEEEVKEEVREEKYESLTEELSDLSDELSGLGEMPQASQAAPDQNNEQLMLEEKLKAEWERIKDKNYYEIFGLTINTFAFDALKKSYFDMTRGFGPEKFFGSTSEVQEISQEFLSKIATAFETLSNVVSKENYDEMLSSQDTPIKGGEEDQKFQLQIQFQSGKVFLEKGQFASAEKAFTNCLNAVPDKAEFHAYLALAIYNNPANKGNAAMIKKAKDLVNKSLTLGKLAMSYALKGSMHLDEGSLSLAEAEFLKAIKINPKNKTATKGLETIKAKRAEENKGFFQKMFT